MKHFSSSQLKFIKIIGLNLVVVFGIFLLEWDIFEVAIAFLIETCINFIVAAFFHHFTNTKTKEPFALAFISLISISGAIIAFMALEAGLIHYLTGPKYDDIMDAIGQMPERISGYEFGYVIVSVIAISLVSYLIQKYYLKQVEKITIWEMLEKLFYIHVFIGIATIIYGFIGFNSVFGLTLFISAKIAIDFFLDKAKSEIAIKN